MVRVGGTTIAGGAGVSILGGAFTILVATNRILGVTSAIDAVQAGYVGAAGLALVVGGVWLERVGWTARDQRRVVLWTLVGGGFLLVVAALHVWDQERAQAAIIKPGFVVLRMSVLGCLGGFIAGFYNTRSQQESARAEENLEQFTALFERAPLPTVALSEAGTVTMWNDAAEALFGYTADEAVGTHAPFVPSDAEREFESHLEQLRKGTDVRGVRTKRQRKDGTRLDVEIWATPIIDGDGLRLVLTVFRDLTASAIVDEQRTVMQRVFRHNLRNELSIVRGYAEQLTVPDAPDPQNAAETIVRAADRLTRLSEHVGRLELESTIRSIDVAAMVRGVAADADATYPDASVTVDAPTTAWAQTVPVVEEAFAEAVENSIVHAASDTPRVDVTVRATGDQVEVRVADDGPGIPDSEWSPIAEQTEQPLRHASGLGLWMMHWAAARSGGALAKSDREPTGTVLTFTLPRTAVAVRDLGAATATGRTDD